MLPVRLLCVGFALLAALPAVSVVASTVPWAWNPKAAPTPLSAAAAELPLFVLLACLVFVPDFRPADPRARRDLRLGLAAGVPLPSALLCWYGGIVPPDVGRPAAWVTVLTAVLLGYLFLSSALIRVFREGRPGSARFWVLARVSADLRLFGTAVAVAAAGYWMVGWGEVNRIVTEQAGYILLTGVSIYLYSVAVLGYLFLAAAVDSSAVSAWSGRRGDE